MDQLQTFIHRSRYSRWLPNLGRRETWDETVNRYLDFFTEHLDKNHAYTVTQGLRSEVFEAIHGLKVLPSMRALMTAGPALERSNVAGYNCAFIAIDSWVAFDEALYTLMCGTGVGFSVERRFVNSLPVVTPSFYYGLDTIVVEDSKEGWANGLRQLLSMLWQGMIPKWDLTNIRPAGSPLKTFGGRASGPEPLDGLFHFAVELFFEARGRRLTTLECHDLMCKIAEIVVVGGVRRAALISLSDLDDDLMRLAKSGEWWVHHKHRALANNSAVYNGRPDFLDFEFEWRALIDSKSGERGIFNRAAAHEKMKSIDRYPHPDVGVNPCGEVLLRPNQFCNLSTPVMRDTDQLPDQIQKVSLASLLGTWQSTLTDLPYLRSIWTKNTKDERLLGVGMAGIMDAGLDQAPDWLLNRLRMEVLDQNFSTAAKLSIPTTAAATCVKPDGNSSQLVNCSSGIHPRHSRYYIRTVRQDWKDPLTRYMVDAGFPHEPCVFQGDTTVVFSFPVKSPNLAMVRDNLDPIDHLEVWKHFRENWCDHNPSITVSVPDHQWSEVGDWVYDNFDSVCGVSFLPKSDHVYQQAPYQEITAEEYEKAKAAMPTEVDWSDLRFYETSDQTEGVQQLACVAGVCEI